MAKLDDKEVDKALCRLLGLHERTETVILRFHISSALIVLDPTRHASLEMREQMRSLQHLLLGFATASHAFQEPARPGAAQPHYMGQAGEIFTETSERLMAMLETGELMTRLAQAKRWAEQYFLADFDQHVDAIATSPSEPASERPAYLHESEFTFDCAHCGKPISVPATGGTFDRSCSKGHTMRFVAGGYVRSLRQRRMYDQMGKPFRRCKLRYRTAADAEQSVTFDVRFDDLEMKERDCFSVAFFNDGARLHRIYNHTVNGGIIWRVDAPFFGRR